MTKNQEKLYNKINDKINEYKKMFAGLNDQEREVLA